MPVSVYIEYISRRPGVPLQSFHAIAGPGQGRWAGQYPEDRLILNIGRTWRLGPEPEYLAVWHTPGKGVERLGECRKFSQLERPAISRIRSMRWAGSTSRGFTSRSLIRSQDPGRYTTPSTSTGLPTPPATACGPSSRNGRALIPNWS